MSTTTSWVRERSHLLDQEQKIRLALTFFLGLYLALRPEPLTHTPSAAGGMLIMLLTAALSRFGIQRDRLAAAHRFELSAVAMSVLDMLAITLLVRGTGTLDSSLYPLYALSLVFAATFFRGLELAFLTGLAGFFYTVACWPALITPTALGALTVRLATLVFVAWYSYALSSVLHSEKRGNDQLLRHLTEGALVFDASDRVLLVNPTLRSMMGVDEQQLEGETVSQVAARGPLFAWLVSDVAEENATVSRCTRLGSFPDLDLPLLEVTTIPCREGKAHGGWVVVCKDLRDRATRATVPADSPCERFSPLSNLRALSQALYDLAQGLAEDERWQAVTMIEQHTMAIKQLLGELLHQRPEETPAVPGLFCVGVQGLLSSTRRLLEIHDDQNTAPVVLDCPEDLPLLQVDRGLLGRVVLRLARFMRDQVSPWQWLQLGARCEGERVVLEFAVMGEAADPSPEAVKARAEQMQRLVHSLTPALAAGEGDWTLGYQADPECRMTLTLPCRPSRDPLATAANEEARPPSADGKPLALSSLRAINELNNILSGIRGYAELALADPQEERTAQALASAVRLSDQASEVIDMVANLRSGVADPCRPEPEAVPAATGAPPATATNRTVLVVDDDDGVREILAQMLQTSDYEVKALADGAQALEYLRTHSPALAFVDLVMPGVDGVEVLRAIREQRPETRTVVMSGCGLAATRQALGSVEPQRLLAKPFGVMDVLNVAHELLC